MVLTEAHKEKDPSGAAWPKRIGFIGLGVMGAPICGHIAKAYPVIAFDLNAKALANTPQGIEPATGLNDFDDCDLVLVCLPNGEAVKAAVLGDGGLVSVLKAGAMVGDLGTTPVSMTQEISAQLADKSIDFVDSPITRTRHAAISGTLSTLVGGDEKHFAKIEPVLRCFSEEATHCGRLGAGQVFKQMNNMVLFQTVHALAEALAVAKAAGFDAELLFEAMSKGSGDSFALRNHGAKALLPGDFPKKAFSSEYALKDLNYAMGLGAGLGIEMTGAQATKDLLQRAIEQGYGEEYFPVILKLLEAEA